VQVLQKPVGVAGLITPWNSNILMICHKLASALAAGCTVVIKPSELSAMQAQVLVECFDDAGLPPGVINVVNGRANDSTYGLFAYVTTSDAEHGKEIAAKIEAGGVMVNDLFDFYDEPHAPIGGFKQSGFGREFGVEGIQEYLGTQSVYAH
jgi:acyl-CoA reductase-like NAD-dependent aldehyde dehydrogenase